MVYVYFHAGFFFLGFDVRIGAGDSRDIIKDMTDITITFDVNDFAAPRCPNVAGRKVDVKTCNFTATGGRASQNA